MRWSTSLGAWARREAVLAAALAAASAMVAFGFAVGVKWLAVVGLGIAAIGAVGRLVIAQRRAGLERRRELAASDRRLRAPVASIVDIDPTLIGVDRADQAILPGGGIPQYVARRADADLREAVRAAFDGRGPCVVVVHGPSKVGKSRSLFQALREYASASVALLVAPVDAGALSALLTPGEGVRLDGTPSVLWLDDLEPFLNEGVTWHTLSEWRAGGSARIVAATYGGKGSDIVASSRALELTTVAADVLQHAREIPLAATDAAELADLRARVDAAKHAALERHGLAAFLVAGPALERKLSTGRHAPGEEACPEGKALVLVAVDWARCGRTDPIPESTLRNLWPTYLRPGELASEEAFERALAWALRPVAGSISLIQRTGSYEAFDYVVRLVDEHPATAPVREQCWAAASATATNAQALAVAWAADRHSRTDIALKVLERARTTSPPTIAAVAGFNLGVTLGDLGRKEEAVETYDDVLARFGDAPEMRVREHVANALFNEGVTLGDLGRLDAEIEAYDELVARFGDAPEPALRDRVARALGNKAVSLRRLGRSEAAIEVYEDQLVRFGDAPEPGLREEAAKALVNKAMALRELGRSGAAIDASDELLARFDDAPELAIRETVAIALVTKGSTLRDVGRSEAAVEVCDEVLARFGDAPEPALREQVAGALWNKAVTLGALGRVHAEVGVYDELLARFRAAPEPALRERVAQALVNQGVRLGELGRSETELGVYDEVLARFGDAPAPALREEVARALYNKGTTLAALGHSNAAIQVYDELLARFGDAPEPALRELVDRARAARGAARRTQKESP